MITVRRSSDRGHLNFGWLDTYHSFAFGDWSPSREVPHGWGFRALRVINEDVVAPGQGFGQHPHRDMEIITYVLSGKVSHRDTLGSVGSIGPGVVQRMSAGTGIEHSEFNGSKTEPVHLLQIWIKPDQRGRPARYEDRPFDAAGRKNRLQAIVTPDGRDGSMDIFQDAAMYAAELDAGREVSHTLAPGRHAWVQVARGEVAVNGEKLVAGDGAAISDEKEVKVVAGKDAEVLVFDLG